jgi:hypothetical protein
METKLNFWINYLEWYNIPQQMEGSDRNENRDRI